MKKKLWQIGLALGVLFLLVLGNLAILAGNEAMIFLKAGILLGGGILFIVGIEWLTQKQTRLAETKSDLVKIPLKLALSLWFLGLLICGTYLFLSQNNWGWFLVFFLPILLGGLGFLYSVLRIVIGKIIKKVSPKWMERGFGFVYARSLPMIIGIWVLNLILVGVGGYLLWAGV